MNCARRGFVRPIERTDHLALLDDMKKPGLLDLARAHDIAVKASHAKNDLVTRLYEALDFDEFACDLGDCFVPSRKEAVGFLLYLYFGKLSNNLQSFTLRDLGVVSVRSREAFQARFIDAAEARAGFAWSQALKGLKTGDPAALTRVASDGLPDVTSDFTRALKRRSPVPWPASITSATRISTTALAVYGRSGAFASHERIVRLLHARRRPRGGADAPGRHDGCPRPRRRLYLRRRFPRPQVWRPAAGVFTELLRGGDAIVVDDLWRGHPEEAAIHHFENDGWTCRHAENGVWTALFGLLFWQELFETADAYASEFDWVPQVLKDRTFAARYARQIAAKLDAVRSGEAAAIVRATIRRHAGDDNGLFFWSAGLPDLVGRLLDTAPPDGLATCSKRWRMTGMDYATAFPTSC